MNREFLYYYSAWAGGPTEETVRNHVFVLTYPMEKWVEHIVSYRLLNMKYNELLTNADLSRKLGDFSETQGVGVLRDLREQIDIQKSLATKYFSEFARHITRPRTIVRGDRVPPINEYFDWSMYDKRRSRF